MLRRTYLGLNFITGRICYSPLFQSVRFTEGLKLSTESLIETAMVSSDPMAACFLFHQEESGSSQLSNYNSIVATIYCEKRTERGKMPFVETQLRRQTYGPNSKQRRTQVAGDALNLGGQRVRL